MSFTFEEFKKCAGSSATASVWSQFLRATNGQAAKCKTCKTVIKCAGGSTSALHNHLRSTHNNINISKRNSGEDIGEPSNIFKKSTTSSSCVVSTSKSRITEYFSPQIDDSLPAILSRMTASDGIPFSLFCTSKDLRMLLISKGHRDVPKSANTIRKLVIEYGEKICKQMKQEMRNMSTDGFTLTFDEWTSLRNRRFLNINVHSDDDFWNLGLVRIWGGMPAENCVKLLNERLTKFGLSLISDIVCICTDAASVMQKVGRILNIHRQLCFAHGIQLAVLDVLYSKGTNVDASVSNENELQDEIDINPENDESYFESDDDEEDNYFNVSIEEESVEIISHIHVFALTNKIRRVVKLFRRSPTKNDDVLQKYVKMEFGGKELNLVLDSRTRWSSLINMFERFYELRTCVQKSLIDLKLDSSNYMFTENEFKILEEIIAVLLPVKLAVEALCRRTANLLTADATFEFMFANLSKCDTLFAREFSTSLLNRVKQRRTSLSSLLQYLQNRYVVVENNEDSSLAKELFPKLKKAEVIKLITSLIEKRKQPSNPDDDDDVTPNSDEIESEDVIVIPHLREEGSISSASPSTLKDEIQRTIDKHLLASNPSLETSSSTNLTTRIRREIIIFEDEGIRGPYLESVYKSLLTIPPTSVEAERAFSSAGQICTRIRCRLSDESLNSLCTLRAFFKKEQNKQN